MSGTGDQDGQARIAAQLAGPFAAIPDLIRLQAELRPDHPALIQDDLRLSYGELDRRMDRIAAAIQRHGVEPGDTVAICAATTIDHAVVLLGALRAGAAVALLPPAASPPALAGMLRDSGARLCFVEEAIAASVAGADHVPEILQIRLGGGALEEWLDGAALCPRPVQITPDMVFNIIYSSGTTGVPKGIVQSHAMRFLYVNQAPLLGFGPEATSLVSTPLCSNTTLTTFLPSIALGATTVLMAKFETGAFLRLAERHRVTHAMLVPVQYRRLLSDPSFDSHDLSAFRLKFCTSAPFPAALKAEVLARWPGGLIEYFGMTEGGGSCVLFAHEHPDKLHTVGRPIPGHDIRIIDEDGREAEAGEIGEIVGHSGAIMTEYHNRPTETAATFWTAPDGRRFVRTGDIGRFDGDGFLELIDRKKDLIISGGFNVYPSDLETILLQHPEVVEAAVVGIPSDQWGETPVAFVVARTPDGAAIRHWANARLGKTQRLADVRVIADLPRNPIGKVLKRELRDAYSAPRDPAVEGAQ